MNENLYETKTLIKKSCSLLGAALAVYIFGNIVPEVLYSYTWVHSLGKGAAMLMYYAVIFPIIFFMMRREPVTPVEKHDMKIRTWFAFLIIAQGLGTLANFASQAINAQISGVTGVSIDSMNPVYDMLSELDPLTILYIGILGPLFEEIIFRAFLINRLVKYGEDIAIVYSAVCFGLMHGNIAQLLYAVIIGLVLGYVYVKTGKMRYNVMIHIWINCGSLLLTFLAAGETDIGLLLIVLSVIWMFSEVPISFILLHIMNKNIVVNTGDREKCILLRDVLPEMFFNIGTMVFITLCLMEILEISAFGI